MNGKFGAEYSDIGRFVIVVAVFVLIFKTALSGLCAEDKPSLNATCDYADARNFNNNGVDLISQKNYPEAIKEFKKALVIDPDFHIARYNLALAYYSNGQIKESIAEFCTIINGSYYFVNAHYNLGTIYLRDEMYDEALGELKTVLELEPLHAEAHFNIGYIYFEKNMCDEAMTEYKKGLQIKPDSIKGHLSLAFLYEKKDMFTEALDEYNMALDIKPDMEDVLLAIGSMQAIMAIKQAIKENPNDAESYIHLGHIYYARGMYKEASDVYNAALCIDPDNNVAETSMQKSVVQHLSVSEIFEKNDWGR